MDYNETAHNLLIVAKLAMARAVKAYGEENWEMCLASLDEVKPALFRFCAVTETNIKDGDDRLGKIIIVD